VARPEQKKNLLRKHPRKKKRPALKAKESDVVRFSLREAQEIFTPEQLQDKRQRRNERLMVALSLLFVCSVMGVVAVTDSNPVGYTIKTIRSLGGKAKPQMGRLKEKCTGLDRDAERKCQEADAEAQASWRGIVRNEGGRTNAFRIGRETR